MKQVTSMSIRNGVGLGAGVGVLCVASLCAVSLNAAPAKSSKTRAASTTKSAKKPATVSKSARKPLPRYLSIQELAWLREARGSTLMPRLVPTAGGEPLPASLPTLPGVTPIGSGVDISNLPALPKLKSQAVATRSSKQTRRMTPSFPRRVAPARVSRTARPVAPRWVRYPLEFQLCGIGLGTLAVNKDRFNRIDRYGLFAMHGNPTAVVVPVVGGGGGAGGGGGGDSAAPADAPGRGGADAAAPATNTTSSLTINQTPPIAGASLFPSTQNGGLPDWASAITVQLDNNHVQWLYKRDTYAMGFVVDRMGFVDAIVVAGIESPIAKTQLEDPVHTVRLGDDLRKVLFRYGYPDTIETYPINVSGTVGAGTTGGAPAAGGDQPPAAAGAEGGGEAAAGGAGGNGVFRTFEVRYEQSYNVVFTVRNNRVARIYIFGDPDFFNERRRQQFRTAY